MAKNPLSKTKPEHEIPRVEGDAIVSVPHSIFAEISNRVLGVHEVAVDIQERVKASEFRNESIDGTLREVLASLKKVQELGEQVSNLEIKVVELDRRLSSLEDSRRAHHDAE
jgi:hypothetical protein